MKKLSLVVTAAVFLMSSLPAHSEMTQAQKDECLLASKNCTAQVDDIYKRMHKLDKEIRKGSRVYTPAELNKLKMKLQETEELLRDMTEQGGAN
jgi:peptidoglycan hydrolase CwlO-like protein